MSPAVRARYTRGRSVAPALGVPGCDVCGARWRAGLADWQHILGEECGSWQGVVERWVEGSRGTGTRPRGTDRRLQCRLRASGGALGR